MDKGHVPRVYIDAPLAVGQRLDLGETKRHHLGTVLRLAADASLILFNGNGGEYGARIDSADRKHMTLTVDARHEPRRESPVSITLIQAIARGDRMDFALAKAVELGVLNIRPVFTERGKVKLDGPRLAKKQAHWQSVAESAAEQSGRLCCPNVAPACSLDALLAEDSADTPLRLMLAPGAARGLRALDAAGHVELLIGPESGLSDQEIARASAAGWQPLAFGPRVLRTETAGMAALAAIQTLWGDLG